MPSPVRRRLPYALPRGRVTLHSIVAPHALPPFDQSAMDGYAVRTCDFTEAVAILPVDARQATGSNLCVTASAPRAAVRIFTGAAIPPGFDAVVMQEAGTARRGLVTIPHKPARGEHIRLADDDVPAGAVIVEAGTLIDARHIAILAAAGVSKIPFVGRCAYLLTDLRVGVPISRSLA